MMIKSQQNRKGAALLIVLIVIMTVTVLGLGFIARTDVELSCGSNMMLRTEMDGLAEAGLEHAKGLLMRPWDVAAGADGYWIGGSNLQLETGSDYYNINITRAVAGYTPRCEYTVGVSAFRKIGTETVGRSNLQGKLRFDPCVAFYAGGSMTIGSGTTINGDTYCGGNFVSYGKVYGDITAQQMVLNGNGSYVLGKTEMFSTEIPIGYPSINYQDFQVSYIYSDQASYPVSIIAPSDYSNTTFSYSAGNPAGIFYCNGNINLKGNVVINGTLVVNGKVTFYNANNTITAKKNFPAMIVNGSAQVNNVSSANLTGLVVIRDNLLVPAGSIGVNINIVGGLYLQYGAIGRVMTANGSVVITAAPEKAAIQIWPASLGGQPYRWIPAGGAHYKAVSRL